MKAVSSIAYSSSANLGPGYDVLAVAHDSFHDRVTVSLDDRLEGPQVRIVSDDTPLGAENNTAGLSLLNLLSDRDISDKVTVRIEKGIPFGLGLGSSGASSAAAVCSANTLFGLSMSNEEMAHYAMQGEAAAAGTPHADNVSASVFGELVLVNSTNPLRVRKLSISDAFSFLILMPHVVIPDKTRTGRKMVPERVEMTKVVENTRYVSSLVAGLANGDSELVREGMNDCIVEPSRSSLFPFYRKIKERALEYDAAGVSVSGAGPSILVVCDEFTRHQEIEKVASGIFLDYGCNFTSVRSGICGGVISENIDSYC